jgi:hypothetical protein
MDEFLNELSTDLDAFLEDMQGRVEDMSDSILTQVEEDNLSRSDLMFWAAAVAIALAPELRRLNTFMASRSLKIAEQFGDDELARTYRRKAMLMAEANIGIAAAAINAKTQETVIAGVRGRELADGIRTIIEQEMADLVKSMDTIVSIRVVGETRDNLWLYVGPADSRNRKFCADIVRRKVAFTPSGIEKLNEHPDLHKYVPPNVSILCGGYGCRHVWWPVSEDYVQQAGLRIES